MSTGSSRGPGRPRAGPSSEPGRPRTGVFVTCTKGLAWIDRLGLSPAEVAWALEVEPGRRCEARELVEALEDAAAEVEAIERGAAARVSVRAEARAERRAAAIVEARMRSDRWRWRAAIGVGMAGLVYVGFVVGLVVGRGAIWWTARRCDRRGGEARTATPVGAR